MEQTALICGALAMACGAAMFSIGVFGWRPVAEKAGAFLETPAAMAGALGWLARFALRAGSPARPRAAAGRALDITPQSGAPVRSAVAAAPSAAAAPPSARPKASGRRRTGRKSARPGTRGAKKAAARAARG